MAEVYYFGCDGKSGHHLRDATGWRTLSYHDSERLRIPRDHDLDGGPMFLPRPEKRGTGALTYLPACDVTVLAWWGSPWDERGAVNTAVLVRGKHDAAAVWTAFETAFPKLAAQLAMPEVVSG